MALLEIIAALAMLGSVGFTVKTMGSAWRQRGNKKDAMRNDLRTALASHDYRKLDDFIVLWSGELDAKTLEHVKSRRDDLFIEDDAKKER